MRNIVLRTCAIVMGLVVAAVLCFTLLPAEVRDSPVTRPLFVVVFVLALVIAFFTRVPSSRETTQFKPPPKHK